jgi:hypothetical protein
MSIPERPRIVFYIDPQRWPQGAIPTAPGVPWTGYRFGLYIWTIQTALYLQRAGYACEISSELPDDGIVVAHRECCTFGGAKLLPDRRRLLIAITADYEPYLQANLQIVQNPAQAYWYKNCHFMLHWPEPAVKPRQPSPRFMNISYIGFVSQLSPELQTEEWAREVQSLGLNWSPRIEGFHYDDPLSYEFGDGSWTDLSEVDAVVAVRGFSSYPTFDHKPASKLINCWLAGVPAILGAESAYRALWKSKLDYIEVHSKEEVIEALVKLRDNPELRAAMIDNGMQRAKEVNADATAKRWIRFLNEIAIPSYQYWVETPRIMQKVSIADNCISYLANRLRRKLSTITHAPAV